MCFKPSSTSYYFVNIDSMLLTQYTLIIVKTNARAPLN